MYHYNRIADERKFRIFTNSFRRVSRGFSKKEVSSELFFSYEFDEFEWIAYDPEDYYQQPFRTWNQSINYYSCV